MICIIVFGVSGVGKTTACRNYVARNPGFLHLTASKLICDVTGASLEQLRHADPPLIMANQEVLARALHREIKKLHSTNVIIDGQCVLDNGREIVVLPVEKIRPLQPTGFVLLEAEPQVIFERRLKDSRLRPLRSVAELAAQMGVNREVVHNYSATLGVPFVIAEAGEDFDLKHSISNFL